jgi:protein-arginine kinase activator protein McsA
MKDFGKFSSSQDPNEMSASMFETLARDNMKDFLQMFRKDYYEKIDFDKGCTFLDEALPHFVPAHYRERKDALNLFVKATLKAGGTCQFLIHTIFKMEEGEINVGIADVPDKAMKAYEKAKERGQLEPKKEYTGDNQCTVCGRTDLPLTITIEARTMTKKTICSVCMHNGGPSGEGKKKKVNLKKLDEEIADYEKLAKKYEEMIKEMPEMPKLPKALAQYAMTPLSNYKSIQAILGDLRAQRMAAMTDMNSETRLEYELKKSLAAEDYEQSAVIRDKLNKKKKGK